MRHIPVLSSAILTYIPPASKVVVDGTLGHGGHTEKIANHLFSRENEIGRKGVTRKECEDFFHLIGVDIDGEMLQKAREYLKEYEKYITYVQASYAELPKILEEMRKKESGGSKEMRADFILLDLGINWDHVLCGERGFSIKRNGPLDMRYTKSGPTAYEILQGMSPYELTEKLVQYGDFGPKRAQEIAFLVSKEKRNTLLKTTGGLRKILKTISLREKELAVVFQVLRILTNKEFDHLNLFLRNLPHCLAPGGRCAIISYHSGEDRIVKWGFKKLQETGDYQILTPKPIVPSMAEKRLNPASRSAKLRVLERKWV